MLYREKKSNFPKLHQTKSGRELVDGQKTGYHGNTTNRNDGNIPKMQAIVSQTIANTYGKQPFHS